MALQDWLNNTVPAVSLLAGDMQTADAQLTTPGASLLECNVADHIDAGTPTQSMHETLWLSQLEAKST